MRLLLEMAMLLAPAPAEDALPLWLVGDWCPAWVLNQRPPQDPRLTEMMRNGEGPGPHCMQWAATGWDVLSGSTSRGYFGRNDSYDRMVIEPGGRFGSTYSLSTAFDGMSPYKRVGTFRQVARRPFEIAFENLGSGRPWQISYRREDKVLIQTTVWKKGDAPDAYPYQLRAP